MKIQYLLLTLTASALGIVAMKPWVQTSQPTQLSQSAQVANNSSHQVNSPATQAVANKVTVHSSGNVAELERKTQSPTAEIKDSKGDDKKAEILAYMNSGGKKYALKDYKGALADFDYLRYATRTSSCSRSSK